MKVIAIAILTVAAYLGATISSIWAVVEFILYLVKDRPFNWWSVWIFITCIVLALFVVIASAIIEAKNRQDSIKNFTPKRSRFQERLEEMSKQRNTK
jgi:uncharacterized membrane protein (DUF106 family)